MESGYVLLWRKAKDSAVFNAGDGVWKMFCYFLMEATHKPIKYSAHGAETTLHPGQFITGRFKLAEDLGCSPSSAVRRMKKLCALGICDTKADTNFTIVTIRNWATYQQDKRCPRTQLPDTTADTTPDTTPDTKQTHNHINTKETTTLSAEPTARRFMDAWNAQKGNAMKVRAWTTARDKQLRARMGDPFWRTNWPKAIDAIADRPFLQGVNDRGWKADVDWFLQPNSVAKILEGKYQGSSQKDDPNKFKTRDGNFITREPGWTDAEWEQVKERGGDVPPWMRQSGVKANA